MSASYELDRILAENYKLRKQLADTCMQLGDSWVRCSEMRSKNDKLRNLIVEMWEVAFSKNASAKSIEEWKTKHDCLYDRIHDLGIEVGR